MTKSARESGEERNRKDERQATRLAFVLLPRFNMMALMAAIEPLRVANYLSSRTLYDWRYLSPDGGAAIASNGLSVETQALTEQEGSWSCVFVCASWNAEQYENKKLFAWLRRLDRLGVPLGAMDLGLYVLARAGLLNGYRAAVLWYCIHAFREAYPEVQAEECLFLTDRRRTTIAGGTAGLDAMLNDIARRHGERLAHEVADHILHHPQRKAASPQRSAMGGAREILHPILRVAVRAMEKNLEEPLSIPEISRNARVSQRKLERLFQRHMDCSAIAYYRALRLQHARVLLTNTDLSIREISVACGYASLSHFAKCFADQYGSRPRDCRDSWPESDPAPVWPGLSTSLAGIGGGVNKSD
jgi:AraC family carnitine catabolism transcriptional activator